MTAPDQHDSEQEALREQAEQHVRDLPAETALGNRDPQGGGEGDPAEYEGRGGS